jgi:hypothetical protein
MTDHLSRQPKPDARARQSAGNTDRCAVGAPTHPSLVYRVIADYFWHFGHQKVERPFWVKRRTMPLHPEVWHFSPSRS